MGRRSSNVSRRNSIFILVTSSASLAETAVSSRAIESSARSASSLENGSWCAHLLRKSINSCTNDRSARPSGRPKMSFHAAHMTLSSAATSQARNRLLADRSIVAEVPPCRLCGVLVVLAFELALDERRETRAEQIHCFADAFLIGDRH